MKLFFIAAILFAGLGFAAQCQDVTINAVNQPAAMVFRQIAAQTGMNFVYSSDILRGMTVTVAAKDKPLQEVLDEMFTGKNIEYRIKDRSIILKRAKTPRRKKLLGADGASPPSRPTAVNSKMLDEVLVVSRFESPAVRTVEIGAKKISAKDVRNTPALFGEADVIRTLRSQPGVNEGAEGVAGMYVHGGNFDENLYMLDNVPLYQVNHFAGLFSAFNTDIIKHVDFYKSSMPAKYDGRLSSFMDVKLQDGTVDGHHGVARLGLTSAAFSISGPIGKRTTYLLGIRRSWFDLLTIPALAIINSGEQEKTRFHYYFMDLNAKVSHRFSNKMTAFASIYYGDDMLKTGVKEDCHEGEFLNYSDNDKYDFHWGNFVAQTGLNCRFNDKLTAELSAAYTRYFSSLKHHDIYVSVEGSTYMAIDDLMKTHNNINDFIIRGDFDLMCPGSDSHIRFGLNYVHHNYLPPKTYRTVIMPHYMAESIKFIPRYKANEVNGYMEDYWRLGEHFRVNAGMHVSLFNIDNSTKHGVSPRLSTSYNPVSNIAVKAAYSRTVQYVHQQMQGYMTLPTDQWIPVTGKFKPQTTDKLAMGLYWQSNDNVYAFSAEGYYKWSHDILEYRDEYYLMHPLEMWNARLTQGRGKSRGFDFMIERQNGRVTGHVSYSLSWSDRTFAEKNGGHTYPARFDNRHTIKVGLNWAVSNRVTLNAMWIGHSGNRFTLLPQMWGAPDVGSQYLDEVPLRAPVNNYQLPFYHRLDISCLIRNRRGYWTLSLYNAYNHMNVIGIKRGDKEVYKFDESGLSIETRPVLQKIKFLPVIPSISYTWEF